MDRIFLDANVLFSASYLENSGLVRLWRLDDAELLSSSYAVEEARRNLALDRPPALVRLERLMPRLTLVNPPREMTLDRRIRLEAKDRPILLAAIHARAGFLLTGDVHHFGHLYGRHIEGVIILRPAQYFARRERR